MPLLLWTGVVLGKSVNFFQGESEGDDDPPLNDPNNGGVV